MNSDIVAIAAKYKLPKLEFGEKLKSEAILRFNSRLCRWAFNFEGFLLNDFVMCKYSDSAYNSLYAILESSGLEFEVTTLTRKAIDSAFLKIEESTQIS